MSEHSERYAVLSLELHLFFARIMKEHSLFLEAGFTPPNASFAQRSDLFKKQFEDLLMRAVRLSDGMISNEVLCSGEIITEFTDLAERQTQRFTGIQINSGITAMQAKLNCGNSPRVSAEMVRRIRELNHTALSLVNGLIAFKENILREVLRCRMFTMNYPLLIEHILREARLYRTYILCLERGNGCDCQTMRQIEQFWNQIMMEHAMFIRGLLDPTEKELMSAADNFADDYARLLASSREMSDRTMTLNETVRFRDFKAAGTKGIENCEIRSIILPLLADHVLREANHYIRLLND